MTQTVREVLYQCYWREHRKDITIDQAINALCEIVEGNKKEVAFSVPSYLQYIQREREIWNECCDDLIRKIKE